MRAAGVQSEMESGVRGLHQLCAPLLRGRRLPGPQRDALHTAFGISSGSVPDRFLLGLAVLGLLAEAGAERPLICLVDDEQWLDTPRPRCWPSPRGVWRRSRSAWCSRRASRRPNWRD